MTEIATELTVSDVERLMATFTYKPNWEFEVVTHELNSEHVAIKVTMWTLNSLQTYPDTRQFMGVTVCAMHGQGGPVAYDTVNGRILVDLSPNKLGRLCPVPEIALQAENIFWEWLRHSVIGSLETHEIDEWFKVNGQIVNDPHTVKWRS